MRFWDMRSPWLEPLWSKRIRYQQN
jgi:hypothetical protein